MRRWLCLFLFLAVAPCHARTQSDLGSQGEGQLSATEIGAVIGTATSSGISAFNAASGTVGARLTSGGASPHGFTERFAAVMRCVPDTGSAIGFEQSTGSPCSTPGSFHSAGSFALERTLRFGDVNALSQAPTHFGLVFSAVYNNVSNAYVGMSTCALGAYHCGDASEIGVRVTNAGFSLLVGGSLVARWNSIGNGAGNVGTTDNGNGNVGFGPPTSGSVYGVSLLVPGDGTAIFGVLPVGGALCYNACNYVVRVPITMPTGSLHRFFVRGEAGDYVGDVAYADGYSLNDGNAAAVYDIPTGPLAHVGIQLRWAMHADGSEWDYKTAASDITNAFALIPPNYNPDASNPIAFQFRGQENSDISFYGTCRGWAESLYQAGYVQEYADFSQRAYYGSPAELTLFAGSYALIRNALSLSSRPYLYGDSAGGIPMLNIISHGLVAPLAVGCVSCNLSLYWDAITSRQMPFVEQSYGFASPAEYAQYTSPAGQVSYDPMVAVATAGTGQNLLASVPMLLVADASPGDITVDTASNTDAFAAAANALRPGIVTVQHVGGGHVSANKFNGPQLLQYFHQH